MPQKNTIIFFSKAPQINRGLSDDPFAGVPWTDLDVLFTAILVDVLEIACKIDFLNIVVYREQAELSDDLFSHFRGRVECRDALKGTFVQQIRQAVENAVNDGSTRIVVVLENNPLLNSNILQKIFDQLGYEDDCIVISPTDEGKIILIGLKSSFCSFFDNAEGDTLMTTGWLMQRLCDSDIVLFPIHTSYSLDSGVNLKRLNNDVDALMLSKDHFPHRTYEIFRQLNKKYKARKIS